MVISDKHVYKSRRHLSETLMTILRICLIGHVNNLLNMFFSADFKYCFLYT